MSKLNENYYLRKCLFARNQVPTQTVMKKKMTEPLANVYFKDMSYKLKVLAGLQPPMRGGGSDWLVAPADLLKGQVCLKPMKKEHLAKLRYTGIDDLAERLIASHNKQKELQKKKALEENDEYWKNIVKLAYDEQWIDTSEEEAERNTQKILGALKQFEVIYATSITKMEAILFDGAIKAIETIRADAFNKMKIYYKTALMQQATSLYDKYTIMLNKEKAKRKGRFIKNVDKNRKQTWNTLHDINIEKHRAIEKLRHFLECQNLACQVYVAIKEKEECDREIKVMKTEHAKKVKKITDDIALTNMEITLSKESEVQRQQFNKTWQIKVCHVVRKFQNFISYCLNLLPDHADFFINMEKLMLLQINQAIENPSCSSIIETEEESECETNSSTITEPKPFFVYGDLKPTCVNNKLYRKGAELADTPVFMINKHYIYAACNNIHSFSTKLNDFIQGRQGNDADVLDDFDYSYSMPVKHTMSHQLVDLRLESSLMQVLQNEVANVKKVSTDCCICKVKHCFCSPLQFSNLSLSKKVDYAVSTPSKPSISQGQIIESRDVELIHEREPKIESYSKFITPTQCKCPKIAKKNLEDHLPPYMMNLSQFQPPALPNYEQCSVSELRRLVAKYRGIRPVKEPEKVESKTRDFGIQYSDEESDDECTCHHQEEIDKLAREIIKGSQMFKQELNNNFDILGTSMSLTYMTKSSKSFATEQALELKELLDSSPDLQEIFKKSNCNL